MTKISEAEKTRTHELVGKNLENLCTDFYTSSNKKLLIGKFSGKLYYDILIYTGQKCHKLLMDASARNYFKLIVKRKPLWDFYPDYKFKLYIRFYPAGTHITNFKCVKQVLKKRDEQKMDSLLDCKKMLYYPGYTGYEKYISDYYLLKTIFEPQGYVIQTTWSEYLMIMIMFPSLRDEE